MSTEKVSLEAKSPFELRVDLGIGVPETDVRSALKSGDLGFLHSFTTGSAVDGPGVRVVAWTHRLPVPLPLLPQPRHLEDVERHPGAVDGRHRAAAQVPPRAEGDGGEGSPSPAASR